MAAFTLLGYFLLCFTVVNRALIIPNVNSNGEVDMVGIVMNLTSEMQNMEAKLEAVMARLKVVEEHDANTTTALQSMKERFEKRVMFTAHLSALDLELPTDGFPVKFDNVITNVGGGYNPHTGVFHTPVAGDYLLMLRVLSTSMSKRLELHIVVNGKRAGALLSVGGSNSDETASTSSIRHLDVGEEVIVERYWAECATCRIYGRSFSQFSGILLKAD